jgi:hypothetical protein
MLEQCVAWRPRLPVDVRPSNTPKLRCNCGRRRVIRARWINKPFPPGGGMRWAGWITEEHGLLEETTMRPRGFLRALFMWARNHPVRAGCSFDRVDNRKTGARQRAGRPDISMSKARQIRGCFRVLARAARTVAVIDRGRCGASYRCQIKSSRESAGGRAGTEEMGSL